MEKTEVQGGLTPGYSKYSVAIMPLEDTLDFPDAPNPEWLKKDVLVFKADITKIFNDIRDKEAIFVNWPTAFIPRGFDGVKVYFDPNDITSLFIIAKSREIANEYVFKRLEIKRKPYNEPTYKPEKELLHS